MLPLVAVPAARRNGPQVMVLQAMSTAVCPSLRPFGALAKSRHISLGFALRGSAQMRVATGSQRWDVPAVMVASIADWVR